MSDIKTTDSTKRNKLWKDWNADLEQIVESVEALSPGLELDENTLEMLLEDAELIIEENKERIMMLAIAAIRLGHVLHGVDIESIMEGLTSEEWEDLLSD